MITGHTKFDPDKGFGHIKKSYNRSDSETILDIQNIIDNSSYNNMSQIIRDPITKNILVNYYDWSAFLDKFFISIPNITKYHHFIFDKNCKNYIHVKEFCDSPLKQIIILKNSINVNFSRIHFFLI